MHENSARRVVPQLPVSVFARHGLAGDPDCTDVVAFVDELGGVVKNQNWPGGCGTPILSRAEMARENLRFLHSIVIQESVGCLRARPILTHQRYASSWICPHLL